MTLRSVDFAGTRAAADGDEPAGGDRQVDVAQGLHARQAAGELAGDAARPRPARARHPSPRIVADAAGKGIGARGPDPRRLSHRTGVAAPDAAGVPGAGHRLAARPARGPRHLRPGRAAPWLGRTSGRVAVGPDADVIRLEPELDTAPSGPARRHAQRGSWRRPAWSRTAYSSDARYRGRSPTGDWRLGDRPARSRRDGRSRCSSGRRGWRSCAGRGRSRAGRG